MSTIKRVAVLIFVLAAALLLVSCGAEPDPLPEGFDEQQLIDRAAEIIGYLNAFDFDAVEAATREDLRDMMSAEVISEALRGPLENLGAFEKFDKWVTFGAENEEEGTFAVAAVRAIYEHNKPQYNLSFDIDLNLIGLYMK